MPRSFLFLPIVALAAACGSSPTGQGGGGATSSSTASGGGGSTTKTTSSGTSTVTACADISATDCFSNLDCSSASDRCQSVGVDLPCCVPGARGTGKGGDSCMSENDCETALCIQTAGVSVCSGACTSAQDCSAPLAKCQEISPLLGTGSFCFP
jgi:hypothetical protein